MSITGSITKISTSVCVSSFDELIDLEVVFNNLCIDETIISMKYHGNFKGEVKSTGSFFNQITVIIYVKKYNKEINLKVFKNGKAQVTGVTSEDQCNETLNLFYNKIKDIRGTKKVHVKIINNIIYDLEDYNKFNGLKHTRFQSIKIYGEIDGSYIVIGERKGNDYIINNEKVVIFDQDNNLFMQIKHSNFIKKIYDKNGKEVGYVQYTYNRPRKIVILSGYKFIENDKKNIIFMKNIQKYNFNEKHTKI